MSFASFVDLLLLARRTQAAGLYIHREDRLRTYEVMFIAAPNTG